MAPRPWRSYEEVAAYLIDQFKEHFGLEKVEGKQEVAGKRSKTDWELDAKGMKIGGEGVVIIECRRHTTASQKQGDLGELAYRVIDTGAKGGIIVSPFPLQEGAKKIAGAEGIIEVTLTAESTTTEYVMSFLNKIMVGLSETMIGVAECVAVKLTSTQQDASAGQVKE